jgi:class 3 adenylate cyclase
MMGEGMGGMSPEEMRERMKDSSPSREIPFYKEKTFVVIVTGILVLLIGWIIKQWRVRLWAPRRKYGALTNEAVLVVDLCESTKLAVTQGDSFAMRITNKMKECVREVSERFGARFFQSTGDGYLITFPTGTDAARAAIKILQNADDYNRTTSKKEKIELRVGISYGELVLDDERGRYGVAINKAFRIEGLKKEQRERLGGEVESGAFPDKNRILVSEELKEEITGVKGIEVESVGVFSLKGFTGLHRIFSIPWKDLA